jgi:adenylyltransferase/sulfurtransferase
LIDVREEWEQPRVDELAADIIPYPYLPQHIDRIDRHRPVVIFCQVGVRSRKAIKYLKKKHGFDNLINLSDGIVHWRND